MYRQFLSDLWGTKEEDEGYILIWAYDGNQRKESYWFRRADEAAAAVEKLISKIGINVYMGCGVSPRNYGTNRRCEKRDIAGIAALWLDLDVADPVHAKGNLPPSIADAMALLDDFAYPPSYVIDSGHGLQAWWVLREVWTFNSPFERADAESLEKRLIYYFKTAAKKRGWDVDSVHNLDRVMRVPGSTNYKSAPAPVRILQRGESDGLLYAYNQCDFEGVLPELPPAAAIADAGRDKIALTLNAAAEPPFDKFGLLCEVEPKFRDSWDKQRNDFKSGDYSMSSYDLSLASIAFAAQWTEQEVCDLLVAFRRKHGADLKMQNLQYYQRTLAQAKISLEKVAALAEIESHAAAQSPDDAGRIEPNQKELLLQSLSAAFGVQLVQIKRYVADPPVYALVTARGNITLGDVDALIGQRALRSKIAAATGKYIPKFKEDRWDAIAQTLLDCCMDIELDAAASDVGEAQEWLELYLETKPPLPEENVAEAVDQQAPIYVDGGVAIFGLNFRKWLRVTQQEKITGKKMGVLLRSVGARAAKLPYDRDGKPTCKSVWIIQMPS